MARVTETMINNMIAMGWSQEKIAQVYANAEADTKRRRSEAAKRAANTRRNNAKTLRITRQAAELFGSK